MEVSIEGGVSVIIPVYNRGEYIRETVESVLYQDYQDVELIVVDDGSTDNSYEILLEYAEQGLLKLLTHLAHENRGQSAALNLGLKEASGEFIAILDSDDFFSPGKLSSQVSFLNDNQQIDFVYGMGLAIDSNGKPLFNTLAESHREVGRPDELLLDCYVAIPGGSLVRKSLFDKVGGFEELFRAGQDHDMALRLFESGRVAYVPEIVFHYRKHGDSISANGLERRWKTGFEILQRAKNRYPYPASLVRKRLAVLNFRLGQTYWRDGRHVAAVPLLLKSFCLDPIRALKVLTGQEQVR
jgi:glycosyltransferase involved in cell wall biosynthesis